VFTCLLIFQVKLEQSIGPLLSSTQTLAKLSIWDRLALRIRLLKAHVVELHSLLGEHLWPNRLMPIF